MSTKTATTQAIPRSQGGNSAGTPAVPSLFIKASFDPTQVSAALTAGDGQAVVLPEGAIVTSVNSLGGSTGGTNPTVDVGTSADPDAFANELPSDTLTLRDATILGASAGTVLATDTTVYGGVGASAATGGTTTILIEYVPSDNGSR